MQEKDLFEKVEERNPFAGIFSETSETNEFYITIAGFKNYYNLAPFRIGASVLCAKEPDNSFDAEAIRVFLPMIGTVGYVANSVGTVAGGTMSAGRLYDKVGKVFAAQVLFIADSKIICKVLPIENDIK